MEQYANHGRGELAEIRDAAAAMAHHYLAGHSVLVSPAELASARQAQEK